jgi:hypothetical protein
VQSAARRRALHAERCCSKEECSWGVVSAFPDGTASMPDVSLMKL